MLTLTRRGVLKAGLLGTAALVAGGTVATMAGYNREPATELGLTFLRKQDISFIAALAPVILKGTFPGPLGEHAETRLIRAVDSLMSNLGEFSKKQLTQLFDLMSIGPARFIAGGPISNWADAKPEDINDFLEGWRNSLFPIKRMGYTSLSKIITMSWYPQPENYAQIGYPGPPKKFPA
jgi:hypothetical protein